MMRNKNNDNWKKRYATRFWVGSLLGAAALLGSLGLAQSAFAQVTVGSGGDANIALSIASPPGHAGPTPGISLEYSSSAIAQPGPYGAGWQLHGVSVISRCAATLVPDQFIQGVKYTAVDKLCLDGQRIIPVANDGTPQIGRSVMDASGQASGSYVEYKTINDSYSRIRAYGYADGVNASSGPAWFRVWTKSGQILDYGNAPSSLPASNALITAAYVGTMVHAPQYWAISHVADVYGNGMDFAYTQSNTQWGSVVASGQLGHEWNISEIQFGCDSAVCSKVLFTYDQKSASKPQDAAEQSYLGLKTLNINRLRSIKTYVSVPATLGLGGGVNANAVPVKTYNLNFDNSSVTKRSRLANFQECAGDGSTGQCLPASQFTYSNGDDLNFTPNTNFNLAGVKFLSNSSDQTYNVLVADFNGDGRDDILLYSNTSDGNKLFFSTGTGAFQQVPNGTGAGQFNLSTMLMSSADGCNAVKVGDFNNDGIADVFVYVGATKPDGTACNTAPVGTSTIYFGNGDGSFRAQPVSGFTPLIASTSTLPITTNPDGSVTEHLGSMQNFMFMDLNGDGIPDVITTTLPRYDVTNNVAASDPCASAVCTHAYLGDGTGKFSEIPTNLAHYAINVNEGQGWFFASTPTLADINGDGLQDIHGGILNYPIQGVQELLTSAISRGDGNFDIGKFDCVGGFLIDYNGSGQPSCLMAGSPNTLWANNAAGLEQVTNFDLTSQTLFKPSGSLLLGNVTTSVSSFPIDFNGDGRESLMRTADDFSNAVFMSNGDGTFTESTGFYNTFNGVPLTYSVPVVSFAIGHFTGRPEPEILRMMAAGASTTTLLYERTNAVPPDLLQSYVDSEGVRTDVSYTSLAQNPTTALGPRYSSDRNTTNAAKPPFIEAAPGGLAVTTLTVDSPVPGTRISTDFSYAGLKRDTSGYGSVGFREIKSQSPGADGSMLVRDSKYLQTYPYVGMPSQVATYLGSLTTTTFPAALSSQSTIYCDQSAASGASATALASGVSCQTTSPIKRTYPLQVTRSSTDLDGSVLPTATTSILGVTATGDSLQTTSTVTLTGSASDTYSQTINSTFFPDNTACSDIFTCQWIVGRVQQTTTAATSPSTVLATSAGTSAQATQTAGVSIATLTSTASQTFPTQAVGSAAATLAWSYRNDGAAPMTLSSPTLTAPLSVTGNTCTSVVSGQSCALTVTNTYAVAAQAASQSFSPQGASNTPAGATAIYTVQQGTLTVAPASVAFSSQTTGTSSAVRAVTLTNTGTASLPVSAISVSAGAGDFTQSNNCGSSLAVNGTCTVNVTFSPSTAGSRTGTLTITANGAPTNLPLSGTGVAVATASIAINGTTTAIVTSGTSPSLSWASTNATTVSISCSAPMAVSATGSTVNSTGVPEATSGTGTSICSITPYNSLGVAGGLATATATVVAAPAVTSFTALPANVTAGYNSSLSWATTSRPTTRRVQPRQVLFRSTQLQWQTSPR